MWHDQEVWRLFSTLPAPGDDSYLPALNALSRKREALPGVVNFEIPPSELRSGKWQGIMSRSDPACDCGARRWIVPVVSRLEVIRASVEPLIVGGGQQVALGPKGGDRETSIAQFSIADGKLLIHVMPHARVSGSVIKEAVGQDRVQKHTLSTIARRLAHTGFDVVERVIGFTRGVRLVSVPVCTVVQIDEAQGLAYLVPDIATSIVDRASRGALHEC